MRLEDLAAGAAERDPDAPAIKDEHGELTYRDLDVLAEEAGRALRGFGRPPS